MLSHLTSPYLPCLTLPYLTFPLPCVSQLRVPSILVPSHQILASSPRPHAVCSRPSTASKSSRQPPSPLRSTSFVSTPPPASGPQLIFLLPGFQLPCLPTVCLCLALQATPSPYIQHCPGQPGSFPPCDSPCRVGIRPSLVSLSCPSYCLPLTWKPLPRSTTPGRRPSSHRMGGARDLQYTTPLRYRHSFVK